MRVNLLKNINTDSFDLSLISSFGAGSADYTIHPPRLVKTPILRLSVQIVTAKSRHNLMT